MSIASALKNGFSPVADRAASGPPFERARRETFGALRLATAGAGAATALPLLALYGRPTLWQ
ncbi:MAG: hypothetical protein KGQ28_06895, partial [Hyphomicrobiales bacterium]|nr:hypothetical protein [Hyphomicrobiales bacterium]